MDTSVQVYAKSWVFEGTGEVFHPAGGGGSGSGGSGGDSCSASICSSTSPTHVSISNNKNQNHKKGHSSKLSDANSERFNAQMSSFSRCATPSPIPHSGQATPTNNHVYAEYSGTNHDYRMHKTNRLTVDYVQSVDLAIAPDATVVTPKLIATSAVVPSKCTTKTNFQSSNGPSSISSQQDDSQYASMLAELEASLIEKKIQATNMSPDDTSLTASTDKFGSSKSSSKDLEFSKELEAALQLIQDLETPSEGPADGVHSALAAKVARSESEKTLSAAISLPSPDQGPYKMQSPDDTQPPQNGKHDDYRATNIIHIEPSSQSTSGYSSPNSLTSNVRLSHASSGIDSSSTMRDSSVYTGDQTNVVRIYVPSTTPIRSLVNTKVQSNDSVHMNEHLLSHSNGIEFSGIASPASTTDSLNKSQLLFKKRSKLMLHSDFQNRIFKSECLAYLTDEELVARHKCNRDIIRVRPLPNYQTKSNLIAYIYT